MIDPNSASIFKMFEIIRARPGMYMGGETLARLEAYVAGWCEALHQQDALHQDVSRKIDMSINVWLGYTRWIEENFEEGTEPNWKSAAMFQSINESDAVRLAIKLFEQFRRENYP